MYSWFSHGISAKQTRQRFELSMSNLFPTTIAVQSHITVPLQMYPTDYIYRTPKIRYVIAFLV